MANSLDINKLIGDVNSLNKSIKNTSKLMSELITKQTTLNKELSTAKGLKSVNDNLNETKKTSNEIEKVGNSLLTQRNKLVAKQDKTLRALTKDVIKNQQATRDLNNEIKAEGDAYKKLNLQYKKAQEKAKKLGAQYGVNSKQAKKAAKEALNLNNQLKKIDSSVGQNQRSVGSYGKSLLNFAGQLGLVTGGAVLLKKGFDIVKDSIMSIQSTGDDFVNAMAGWKEGYNSFLRSMASGTSFSNLIKNFKDATAVGREYSAILDDLGDRMRALRIAESEARYEQEQLLTVSRDVSKTDEDRLAAIDEYIKIEKELTDKRIVNAKIEHEANILIASQRSNLSKKEIENYLKDYGKLTTIETDYIKAKEKRTSLLGSQGMLLGGSEEQQKAYFEKWKIQVENVEKQIESLNNKRLKQYDIVYKSNQLNDKQRDKLTDSYTNLINIQTNSLKTSQRVLTMRGSLIKRMAAEKDGIVKYNGEVIKSTKVKKAYIEGEKLAASELTITNEELNDRRKILEDEWTDYLKMKSDEQSEIRKQALKDITIQMISLGNTLFDLGQAQRDRELSGIRSNYNAQILAAGDNAEVKERLARELAREEAKIQREQAQSEKNQALYNIAINTAQGVANAWKNPYAAPFVIPLIVASGILQAGIVGSQPLPEIPGFFKGTESAPAGLAMVGERGRELISSGGQMFIAEKPQLMDMKGGETVYNNFDTERMLNAAIYKDVAINGNEGIENRLDTLINKIANQPKEVTIFDDNGIKRYLQNGNSKTTYLNRKGRK